MSYCIEQLGKRRDLLAMLAELSHPECAALLFVDLSDFRSVNIDFGHGVGDEMLQQVATRLQGMLRDNDRIFHLGGDEFALVLRQLKSPQIAELAADKVIALVAGPLEISGHIFSMAVHVGVAVFPSQAGNATDLLQAADVALHDAQRTDSGYRIYDQALMERELARADLKGKLKVALDNSDLILHYQPQIDLQRGMVNGCEALVRWNHRNQGWIRPDLFIPVAEQSDLIDSLTYWSINVALREWFQYCGSCSEGASVSVNLSAKLLHSAEIVELVRQAMSIWGAGPGMLVLEVTESAMMVDPNAALDTLKALNDMGVTISIDDFGTGYSSLSYLKKLPVEELKIDKSFVMHMAEDKQDRKIVQAVIDMAHNLDIRVVAEGIENQQSLDMLIGMGCDYGQGYYIARPMALVDLPPWLDNSIWSAPKAVTG